jgi:hypothetical protein
VAGEYVASTFRTEMSQVGKVAGYTNSEKKEMSQMVLTIQNLGQEKGI